MNIRMKKGKLYHQLSLERMSKLVLWLLVLQLVLQVLQLVELKKTEKGSSFGRKVKSIPQEAPLTWQAAKVNGWTNSFPRV